MGAPRISPGRLTAVWVVLRSVEKLGDSVPAEQLLSFARRSGLRCGGLPIEDGFDLALFGGFVAHDDLVRLTELGREALSRGAEEEPTREVLRLFLSVYLLRRPPAWIAYWQGDPASLDIVLPDPTRDLLRQAGLRWPPPSASHDLEAWAWWDALGVVPVTEEAAAHRRAIGDAAERMSFEYERNRLRGEGFPELANQVRWVARESPAYGFDVLSFCGSTFRSDGPAVPLGIEVKGMALLARMNFRFHVTAHEWKTAQRLGSGYVFHLWDGVRAGSASAELSGEPMVCRAHVVEPHLPSPPGCSNSCHWESAFVVLPLDSEHNGRA